MKNKIIIYAVIALILINPAYAEKYFVLDVNYILGSLTFNSISLKELDKSITYHDKSGFLIKVLSFDGAELKSIHYNMSENKDYIIYMPYDKNAAKMVVYNQQNSIVMDIGLSSFADTCGNNICEPYESYESCKTDCHSGGKDDFCDGVKDGICDPDCSPKTDTDCQETKNDESVSNQVDDNQSTINVKNTEINNGEQAGSPSYFNWISYGVAAVLIVLLAFFFIKKRKENRIVSMLKQYISENIRKGYTLQQIKDVLFREGYGEKEIDKAVKSI